MIARDFTLRASQGKQPLSLEERYSLLERENRLLRSQLAWAERGIKPDEETWWLRSKIERQRLAILRLQWHGWEPDLIIEEVA